MDARVLQHFMGNPHGLMNYVKKEHWNQDLLLSVLTQEAQKTFFTFYADTITTTGQKMIIGARELEQHILTTTFLARNDRVITSEKRTMIINKIGKTSKELVRLANKMQDVACNMVWLRLFSDPSNRIPEWR